MAPTLTRLSKVITVLLLLTFGVNWFVPDTASYLALVPGRTLPCVWNLVTAGLIVINPAELVINIISLLLLARLVEPIYGSKEFLKFLLVVDILTCSAVFVAVYITYAITASGTLLYTQFAGFHGLIAAMLVAVKQIMPQHEVKLLGVLKFRVKYLPSLLLLPVAGTCFGLKRLDFLAFYAAGTYTAWLYLRFFQQQPDTQLLGDASDDFKFSSFFPEFLAPVIDTVAFVLGFITRLRHAPEAQAAANSGVKGLHAAGGPSVLGSDTADASRRRERGAKALEERLGQKAMQVPGTPAVQGAAGDVEAGAQQAHS